MIDARGPHARFRDSNWANHGFPNMWSGLNWSIMDSGSLPWEKSITRVAVNTERIDATLLKQTTYITGDHR